MEVWEGMVANYVYEFDAFCTSIITRQADGTILHGRNLDFDYTKFIHNLTYHADFVEGEKHRYSANMFAGHMGVFTGFKAGGFSISENERYPSEQESLWRLVENMILIYLGFDEISWTIRKSFEKCETYSCAYNYLTTHPVIAPGYIIMAGIEENEGTIISRDRWGPAHIDTLSEDRWYLAQTNDDHWTGVCADRCQEANKNLKSIGKEEIDLEKLKFDVLF